MHLQVAVDGVQREPGKAVSLVRQFDAWSPRLALAAANGTHIPLVVITMRRPNGKAPIMETMTLTDVQLTDVSRSATGTEVVAMSFGMSEDRFNADTRVAPPKRVQVPGGWSNFDKY